MKRSAGFARRGPTAARVALLRLYGADKEVEGALLDLHQHWYRDRSWPLEWWRVRRWPEGEALRDAVGALAHRFGLDALGERAAADVIHGWCLHREAAGEGVRASSLVSFLGPSYTVPDSERAIAVTWRPDQETRAEAEKRLRKEVAAALDGIREAWKAAGWEFPDTANMAPEHLKWLYLRLRHRWTYLRIAQHVKITETKDDAAYYQDPEKAVSKAVRAMAAKAGATIPDAM